MGKPAVTSGLSDFREEARAFLTECYPDRLRNTPAGAVLAKADYLEWQGILAAKGWAAPGWPVEHGGAGWDGQQKRLWLEELARADAMSLPPMGLGMLGPVICRFGTEEQKARLLPGTLSGEIFWCQGYSEPQAGSDLAGLTTRAERRGERYVVNGQKLWTSMAHLADWIFCLVKTDPGARAQAGISFLLIDMASPGIEVKPILGLTGERQFNEVWFRDVEVPVENRVHEENAGWTCAKYLLGLERVGIANVAGSRRELERLHGRAEGDDRRRAAEVEIELLALAAFEGRVFEAEGTGRPVGPAASVLKVRGTEIQQALAEVALSVAGSVDGVAMGNYLQARRTSIFGGTNEVQRNIIAKMLGL